MVRSKEYEKVKFYVKFLLSVIFQIRNIFLMNRSRAIFAVVNTIEYNKIGCSKIIVGGIQNYLIACSTDGIIFFVTLCFSSADL